MAMSEGYRNAIATHGASLITHIGLVNDQGTELSGGGYARKPVYWSDPDGGVIRPYADAAKTQDLEFAVPAGKVGGWRGYSAATGGTNYGGENVTVETYAAAGEYRLKASLTAIKHLDAV